MQMALSYMFKTQAVAGNTMLAWRIEILARPTIRKHLRIIQVLFLARSGLPHSTLKLKNQYSTGFWGPPKEWRDAGCSWPTG